MQKRNHDTLVASSDQFSTDAAGLPEARASQVVELSDGDELDLRIAPVAKQLGDATVRMLALQRLDPRANLEGAARLGGRRHRREPRRHRGHGPLARATACGARRPGRYAICLLTGRRSASASIGRGEQGASWSYGRRGWSGRRCAGTQNPGPYSPPCLGVGCGHPALGLTP